VVDREQALRGDHTDLDELKPFVGPWCAAEIRRHSRHYHRGMATVNQLRQRSDLLFTQLLVAQGGKPGRRVRRPVAEPRFSWFDPVDAAEATALAFRLSALAATTTRVSTALERVLDHVEEETDGQPPELVRQGFALFVTHNRDGRRLSKPRTASAAPGLFSPPPARTSKLAVSLGGESPQLDYWREDVLLNEHHQHWHEVYPYAGLPPKDFNAWVGATPKSTLIAIMDVLRPGQGAAFVNARSNAQLAQEFARIRGFQLRNLDRAHYRAMFRPNDRQGELFFYMHQQMLARYDAELLSNGLARVKPLSQASLSKPIPEGYDPEGFRVFGIAFTKRNQNKTLDPASVTSLRRQHKAIRDAITRGTLKTVGAQATAIDPNLLGEATEAATWQISGLDPNEYPGLHNSGHGAIAALSPGQVGGVMTSTATAVRDQVFWRWHKAIDDLSAEWQEARPANNFADAPNVLVRDSLVAQATPWASPDIILCRTADLPQGNVSARGTQLFGGAQWNVDFTARPSAGAGTVTTISELTTTMATTAFGNRQIRYLTHEPFTTFIRVENLKTTAQRVTLRVFLAPAAQAADRRAWIEIDKFLVDLPAKAKVVVARSDKESSVVKRKVDLSPNQVLAAGNDPDDDSYCDCGWPYTLLLPRGNANGMQFRLLVLCTDAKIDKVGSPGECGSMSFCGAVDRYPDAREMGYPFNRPFGGAPADAIERAILSLSNAGARTITIRHTN
jgi:hypothetical protein